MSPWAQDAPIGGKGHELNQEGFKVGKKKNKAVTKKKNQTSETPETSFHVWRKQQKKNVKKMLCIKDEYSHFNVHDNGTEQGLS